jgi:hypothetical protein
LNGWKEANTLRSKHDQIFLFQNDNMSRIAPNLLYLTIYNPTLQPSGPVAPDDEDAEEQAHILFYTSKERAVSRDRMLRQVGLAKALISFSESVLTNKCNIKLIPCQHVQRRRPMQQRALADQEDDYGVSRAGFLDTRSAFGSTGLRPRTLIQ